MNLLTLLRYNLKWPVYSVAGVDHIFGDHKHMFLSMDATGELYLSEQLLEYKRHTGLYSAHKAMNDINFVSICRMGDIRRDVVGDEIHPCEVCLPVTKDEVNYILSYLDNLP